MKILQVVQEPVRRGAEITAFQLSAELRRKGHDVRTVYLYPNKEKAMLPLVGEDKVLGGNPKSFFEFIPGVHAALAARLDKEIRDFKPDIVQLNAGRTLKYGAALRRKNKDAAWALVYRNVTNITDWFRGPVRSLYYKLAVMPYIDGVVSQSRKTLKNLVNFYRFSVPAAQIPSGIDPDALKPLIERNDLRDRMHTAPRAKVIIYVGRLSQEKRVDRLLRVMKRLKNRIPELVLWVLGEGPQEEELKGQARSLTISGSIRFITTQDDVASYLNAADMLLLTSDTEGTPRVIMEAGFMGLPAAATRVGGIEDCVLDGKTALLAGADEEEKLSDMALNILLDDEKRRSMSEDARKFISENFTIDRIASRYVKFYEEVIMSRRERR